jgi:hypothetical protein
MNTNASFSFRVSRLGTYHLFCPIRARTARTRGVQ